MRYVALLRGINVGRAKRVAMSDLRDAVVSIGGSDVKTLLNSGNVVFSSTRKPTPDALERAVADRTGVTSRVTVLTVAELGRVVDECPLVAIDASRLLVAVSRRARDVEPLLTKDWDPEALAVGSLAAYLWCPDGVLKGRLSAAVNDVLGADVTARNWSTMTKIASAVSSGEPRYADPRRCGLTPPGRCSD